MKDLEMTEVRVPTLGESVSEATVATWFKKPGEAVAQDEMLCELETDKVTVEVPAPMAGVLSEIVATEGTTVAVDALLANISEGLSLRKGQQFRRAGSLALSQVQGRFQQHLRPNRQRPQQLLRKVKT